MIFITMKRLVLCFGIAWLGANGVVSSLSATQHYVTGANGYLGRAIVHEILSSSTTNKNAVAADDDKIVCLVRPSRISSEQAYWNRHLQQVNSDEKDWRVIVKPYDMLDGGKSVEAALAESTMIGPRTICLHHVASVFGPTENHVQTALDNVRGTTDIIEALAKAVSNKANDGTSCQFILTSSMAAVRGTGQVPENGEYYTVNDWNTLSDLNEANSWGTSYQWSKTESERQAWECCRRHGIPMVSICPSFVFGPPTGSNTMITTSSAASEGTNGESFSMQLVRQWLRGESPVQSRLFVDVRDVAQAHIAAARRMDIVKNKRWIVSQESRIPSEDIADWLRSVCQESGNSDPGRIHHDADFQGGAIPIGQREVKSAELLQDSLGISLHPVKETIMEMARMLLLED